VAGGYARLVLKLADDVESEVTTAGTILVIKFRRPIDIRSTGCSRRRPITSPRRPRSRWLGDPAVVGAQGDINTMTPANGCSSICCPTIGRPASRLPSEWSANSPSGRGRGTRVASAARDQRGEEASPVRIRASVQPTFVRFVFETPDGVGVSSVLNDQKLTLFFNAALTFDLADAKLRRHRTSLPSIRSRRRNSAVEVMLIGDVDVHSFREDKNYIIDVAYQQTEKPAAVSIVRGKLRMLRRQPLRPTAAPRRPSQRAPRRLQPRPRGPPGRGSPSWNSGAIAPPTSN